MAAWTKAARRWLERRAFGRLALAFRLPSGLLLEVRDRGDWVLYNDIFVAGEYDEPLLAALAASPPERPFTVLDLGANVGYFALRVEHLIRCSASPARELRVVAVEGNPRCLEAPCGLGSRARAVFGLVGSRTGCARISDRAFHPTSRVVDGGRGAWVDYVDLETLVPAPEAIALLKCDVEGSELAFLESYPELLARVQSAVFEIHSGLCDPDACARALARSGLRPRKQLRRSRSTSLEWFARGAES